MSLASHIADKPVTEDKAGKDYWDDVWAPVDLADPIDPKSRSVHDYVHRRFDELFREVFAGVDTRGMRLVEIGCANSAILPYFALQFGFEVSGIDYSEHGAEMERRVLAKAGVSGEVYCADLFSPPEETLETFDVVVSNGVVEHFAETSKCVAAMANLLKPGGTMITIIPNMTGGVGLNQRMLNPTVYHIHVPLDVTKLRKANEDAGLTIERCRYFLGLSGSVANLNGLPADRLITKLKRKLLVTQSRIAKLFWLIEERTFRIPASKLLSPYVVCVAKTRPGAERLSTEVDPSDLPEHRPTEYNQNGIGPAAAGVVRQKRIALVINSLGPGGAQRVLLTLADLWAESGCDVTLITLSSLSDQYFTPGPKVKLTPLGLEAESPNLFGAIANNRHRVMALRKVIADLDPDAVISFLHSPNVLTLLACRPLKIPVIVSERVDPRYASIGRLWDKLRDLTYPRADALVVQTRSVSEWARSVVPAERIVLIPNPISPAVPEYVSSAERERVILGVGRLTYQKGFDILIEAFQRSSAPEQGWSLKIVGDGEERERLRELSASLGVAEQVNVTGRYESPFEAMMSGSIFVLSSRFEGFPNALLEAMACGMAAISADCPAGPADIIANDVDGLLVPMNDVDALAIALSELTRDSERRKRLAERAVEVRERFAAEMIWRRWDELVDRTIAARRFAAGPKG